MCLSQLNGNQSVPVVTFENRTARNNNTTSSSNSAPHDQQVVNKSSASASTAAASATASSSMASNHHQQNNQASANLRDRIAKLIKDIVVHHGDNIQYMQLDQTNTQQRQSTQQQLGSVSGGGGDGGARSADHLETSVGNNSSVNSPRSNASNTSAGVASNLVVDEDDSPLIRHDTPN